MTQEDSDKLFFEMYKAGYEWDSEKKELKKIEVTSKESEDEGIRKALIEYFGEQYAMSDWNGVYGYQVLAWLEKQGKKLDADEVIGWLKTKVYDDSTYGMAMIEKFKQDFGL